MAFACCMRAAKEPFGGGLDEVGATLATVGFGAAAVAGVGLETGGFATTGFAMVGFAGAVFMEVPELDVAVLLLAITLGVGPLLTELVLEMDVLGFGVVDEAPGRLGRILFGGGFTGFDGRES